MAEAGARLRFARVAPRKVRLVADLIRGKTVGEARDVLAYTPKNASSVLGKVLASAVANAENKAAETRQRIRTDQMVITRIWVDGGPTLRRFRAAMRGRAVRIRKRTSHVDLVIAEPAGKPR